MNGIVGLAVFSLFAYANATLILKLKKPKQIFLSAAIIAAPWQGGLWIGFILFDLRLTYIFLFIALAMLGGKAVKGKKLHNITLLIIVPTFLLIIWSTVVSLSATNPNLALGVVLIFIINYLYFNAINKTVDNINDVDFIIRSLILGLLYPCILALIQYKSPFFHIGFIDGIFTTFMFWRTRSTFLHANHFGMYQMFVLPVLFRQIIIMFQMKKTKLAKYYIVLFLISLFTLYTTGNRGSWLGFAVGMIVVILMDFFRRGGKKTKKIMIRVISIVLILISVASIKYGKKVYDRFYGEEGSISAEAQAEHRSELNEPAYRILKKYPITGIGLWNFRYYASVIFTHNLYLLIPSEVGYVGLLFFLWFLLGLIIETKKGAKEKNFYVSNMNSALLSIVLGLILASIPGPDYWMAPLVSCNFWIIVGIVFSINRCNKISLATNKLRKRRPQSRSREQLKLNSINI